MEKRELTSQTLHLFNEEQLYLIFKLVYSAAPEYYQIFLSEEENNFLEIFKGQLTSGSELEKISIYSLKNELAGISVSYESSQVSTKNQFSTLLLLRESKSREDSIFRLRQYNLNFPANHIPHGAKYLSRIAIREEFKGSGISGRIFDDVCHDDQTFFVKNLYLLVHKQNERAIKFYNKMKMSGVNFSQQNSIYDVMEGSLI